MRNKLNDDVLLDDLEKDVISLFGYIHSCLGIFLRIPSIKISRAKSGEGSHFL